MTRPALLLGLAGALALLLLTASPAGRATATSAFGSQRAPCRPQPERGRDLVLISSATGTTPATVAAGFPDVNGGGVSAVAADGRGGWLLIGQFLCVGDVPTRGLARLDHAGALDRSFLPQLVPGRGWATGYLTPQALLVHSGVVYVGGRFGVLALSAQDGHRLWRTPLQTSPHSQGVYALAFGGNRLYLGGDFSAVAGHARQALAALDPRSGRLLGWQGPRLGGYPGAQPSVIVAALALSEGRLYLGGSFLTVGGRKQAQFAAISATTGRLSSWHPAPGLLAGYPRVGDVDTIVPAAGLLFSAGLDGFGVTVAQTGRLAGWWHRVAGRHFARQGDLVYLAGDCRSSFTAIDGQPRDNLAAVHVPSGAVTSWAPTLNTAYSCVDALAAQPDEVLVAGFFGQSLG